MSLQEPRDLSIKKDPPFFSLEWDGWVVGPTSSSNSSQPKKWWS